MATAERKGEKASTEGASDHFEKMLEGPCLNHDYLVKQAYRDYGLMKKFLSEAPRRGRGRGSPTPWRTMPRERRTPSQRRPASS
jgi:hypothetical protein